MSRRRSPRRLGSVISELFASQGMGSKLADAQVITTWEDIVGDRIGKEIGSVRVRGSRLIVRVKSPVWRQELHLNRMQWLSRLNEEIGSERISEIVFR